MAPWPPLVNTFQSRLKEKLRISRRTRGKLEFNVEIEQVSVEPAFVRQLPHLPSPSKPASPSRGLETSMIQPTGPLSFASFFGDILAAANGFCENI